MERRAGPVDWRGTVRLPGTGESPFEVGYSPESIRMWQGVEYEKN